MRKPTSTSNDSWKLWIEPQLSSSVFVVSLLLVVSVIVPWLFFLVQMYAHCFGSRADKRSSSHSSHIARACVISLWVLFLVSSTPAFTSSPSSSSLWSPCCSCCSTLQTSTVWWTNTLRTSAEDLGTLAENVPPQVMSPTTTSSRKLMSITPKSQWPSNGSLETSTTMTSPSVRRSLTRAEDEPITPKKKACRPVCRRQWVMKERVNPLFAVTRVTSKVTKFRGKTLKANSLGLSWTDKGSKSSLPVKRILKSTNSKLIMTEEIYKKLSETIESQKEEICRAHQGDERCRQDHQLIHEQLLKQKRDLREIHEKSLSEMVELKRFQGSTFDTIAKRKFVEDRDTILELNWQETRIAEWYQLYVRFRRFSKCWIRTQWTFPRCQWTCVFSHLIQFLVEC